MEIRFLYRDSEIFVVEKPIGVLSEESDDDESLANALKAQNDGYIGVVHRLDRGVGGVMVYARTKSAAARLSTAVQSHALQKGYLAIVHGTPSESSGTLTDLLYHDRTRNKSFVVDRPRSGVKEAVLEYKIVKSWENAPLGMVSLVKIQLHTGRTHQIRVQFSSRGYPLVGDGKYGSREKGDIRLHAHTITFPHPRTGKLLTFESLPAWA